LGHRLFQKLILEKEVKSPTSSEHQKVLTQEVLTQEVLSQEEKGGNKRVYTSLDNQCVQQNAPFGVYVQQQIKELAGMFAVVLEQEEADGTKHVHATIPADSKEGIDLPLCISLSM